MASSGGQALPRGAVPPPALVRRRSIDLYDEPEPEGSLRTRCMRSLRHECVDRDWGSTIKDRFPFLRFMPGYDRSAFFRDAVTALTVSVILIPQSLAYTVLAGMPVRYGLFGSFMPPLIYAFLGGSKEVSIGPFALISLVLAQSVPQLIPGYNAMQAEDPDRAALASAEVIMALTLLMGLAFLAMALLQMGWIISLFSRPVMNAVTCAGAYVICTTQIATILQVKLAPDATFPQAWAGIANGLPNAHILSCIIGFGGIIFLLFAEYLSRPPRFKIPPPTPLFLTIFMTLVSYLAGFKSKFGIKVVQEISDEFPSPTVPNIANFSGYVTAALSLAIINYVVVMAVVQRFASENGYSVDANQELFALGVVSTVSAFFRAQAPSASLSRSSLANSLSPASPLWNIGQFAIVALCIGAFSKLLFHLPYATLAAIIIAAFRPVLARVDEAIQLWKASRKESVAWAVTFLVTLLTTTQYGLVAAIGCSIAVLISDVSRPHWAVLGRLKGTHTYRNVLRYPGAQQLGDVLIFRFDSLLHFANAEYFSNRLSKAIDTRIVAENAHAAAHAAAHSAAHSESSKSELAGGGESSSQLNASDAVSPGIAFPCDDRHPGVDGRAAPEAKGLTRDSARSSRPSFFPDAATAAAASSAASASASAFAEAATHTVAADLASAVTSVGNSIAKPPAEAAIAAAAASEAPGPAAPSTSTSTQTSTPTSTLAPMREFDHYLCDNLHTDSDSPRSRIAASAAREAAAGAHDAIEAAVAATLAAEAAELAVETAIEEGDTEAANPDPHIFAELVLGAGGGGSREGSARKRAAPGGTGAAGPAVAQGAGTAHDGARTIFDLDLDLPPPADHLDVCPHPLGAAAAVHSPPPRRAGSLSGPNWPRTDPRHGLAQAHGQGAGLGGHNSPRRLRLHLRSFSGSPRVTGPITSGVHPHLPALPQLAQQGQRQGAGFGSAQMRRERQRSEGTRESSTSEETDDSLEVDVDGDVARGAYPPQACHASQQSQRAPQRQQHAQQLLRYHTQQAQLHQPQQQPHQPTTNTSSPSLGTLEEGGTQRGVTATGPRAVSEVELGRAATTSTAARGVATSPVTSPGQRLDSIALHDGSAIIAAASASSQAAAAAGATAAVAPAAASDSHAGAKERARVRGKGKGRRAGTAGDDRVTPLLSQQRTSIPFGSPRPGLSSGSGLSGDIVGPGGNPQPLGDVAAAAAEEGEAAGGIGSGAPELHEVEERLRRLTEAPSRAGKCRHARLVVVVCGSGINQIDMSSLEVLQRLFVRDDVLILFAGLKPQVMRKLVRFSGIAGIQDLIFPDLSSAITCGRAFMTHRRALSDHKD